jgi:multiple sugar transport system ATP-binding protein
MAGVRLSQVRKSFGATHVVKGVDLDIADGEFIVLVGGSGCGKSTLLRMVAGLEEPTSGEISIGGRSVNGVAPRDRDIAMVFQSYALYPHMTTRENMAFALRVRRTPDAEVARAVNEAAELLGITSLLDRYPREMSGGQRQRVAMGRAIVRRPQAFLFDEPLSNLDAGLRSHMRVELKRLHHRLRTTTIYVTHDQVEAMTLADRIALMSGGVVQQLGAPGELFDWPANRYVAGFLGSPTMNFFDAMADNEVVEAGGVRLNVASEILRGDVRGRVIAGVRPHTLTLRRHNDSDGRIDGVLEVMEPMGWETHLHVRVGDSRLVARVDTPEVSGLAIGQPLTLWVPPTAVRLFDAVTEKALCGPPDGPVLDEQREAS